MTKHTLDQLLLLDSGVQGGDAYIFVHRDGTVVDIATVHAVENDDQTLANARLLAAAPDLLEALKEALRCSSKNAFDFRDEPWVADARAAIAKAEGGAA